MTPNSKLLIFLVFGLLPFTVARLSLCLFYPETFASLSHTQILEAFVYGLRFDASILVLLCSPFLILFTLPFSFARNKYYSLTIGTLLFLVALSMSFLLAADFFYFNDVKRHITNELSNVTNDIYLFYEYAMKSLKLALFLFVGAAATAYYFWYKLLCRPNGKVRLAYLQALLLWATLFVVARGGAGLKPIAIVDAFAMGDTNQSNLLINGVFSALHSRMEADAQNHSFFANDDLAKISGVALDKPFPLSTRAPGTRNNRNLVVIVVESLTPKYVDSFGGNNLQLTPVLDELAQHSWKFTNFYAYGQRSIDGLQAVLTGIPLLPGLPNIGSGLSTNYTRLGSLAARNGYTPIFVSSTPRRSFRVDSVAGAAGFKHFYGKEDIPLILNYEEDHFLGWDYESLMFLGQKITELPKPFVSYAFPTTDHTPFPKLPAQFMKHPHSETEESGFLNTLHYTDWAIGEFLNYARQQDWFDNTIFVITADHVLAHWQNGGFLDKFRIPLLIYAPKILQPKVISTVTSQLDLVPTFVELLGLEGEYSAIGESLLSKTQNLAYVKEGSVLGIITDRGYLKHSLHNRLEAVLLDENSQPSYLDSLEKRLLAFDQLSFELLHSNRWAR